MDNINDIISSLSADDINMLKGVAASIIGDEGGKSEPNQNSAQHGEQVNQNALGNLGLNSEDFNMMMKAKSIFDKMNSASNKNTDLILALKPHLSPENRNKADTAVKILKLFDVLPMLKELF
ncbi:MAG: hypothetical protein LIO43_05345 [Clostridiales bacterium]|nr:hypothetical protein [Clostridiales bacterium]